MKKKIALVTGGDSGEITISLKSANNINKYIDKDKFITYLIVINGTSWTYTNAKGEKTIVEKNDFSIIDANEKITFDCVFIAIHGTPGEDGKLQGYFDLLRLPYTTCDRTTSAMTFNKFFCNTLVKGHSIVNVSDSVLLRRETPLMSKEQIQKIGFPCFVKPNEAGSSLGVSRVNSPDKLEEAIQKAFAVDEAVLVEKYIKGREITCGVLKTKGKTKALPVTEIISKNEYFDFDAKYDKAKADEITPAQIPTEIYENCREVSKELYGFLNCKGIVRFDYIMTAEGEMYFLEVNTIPGLTDESIVPQQAEAAGISSKELFTTLLNECLNK